MTRPGALAGIVVVAALWVRAAVLEGIADARADALARRLAAVEAHVGDVDEDLARHEHDAALGAEAWAQRCRWWMEHSPEGGVLRDLAAVRCPRDEACGVTWAMTEWAP